MSNEVFIRRAVSGDAARLAELSGVLGYPVDAAAIRGRLDRLLASDTDLVVVAVSAGEVCGWLHGTDREFLETGRQAEIAGLVVDASVRRGGVGRLLVAAMFAWARDRQLTRVVVRSNAARAESHPFYEGIGFERFKTQHVYRHLLQPARVPGEELCG